MKLHIEIDPAADEEIEVCVRARRRDARLSSLCSLLERELSAHRNERMLLTLGDTEYFVPQRSILFFETDGQRRITAHTARAMYYTSLTLRQLEELLPTAFLRVSKSCILNTAAVCSLTHSLTGSGEVRFEGCEHRVYISRAYFKVVKEKIHRMHIPTE